MDDTDLTGVSLPQKKILIMSAVCEMLSICIISSNIARYSEDRSSVYKGIMILSLIIMIIWMLAFFGVINKFQPFIYFAWIMWALVIVFWLFFISGCISPTRCPEGLWLIENDSREGVPVTLASDLYYDEFHLPLFDPRAKKKDEKDMNTFDKISNVVDHHVPLIKFNGLYKPWSSAMGAFIYLMSFSLVFIFFTLTLVALWQCSNEIDSSRKMFHGNKSNKSFKIRPHYSKKNPDLIHMPPDDLSASSGNNSVNQTIAYNPCWTPVIDCCVTAAQSQNQGSQSRQQRVCRNREVYETLEPSQPQIPTADGQINNEQPGRLARIARYACRNSTNT